MAERDAVERLGQAGHMPLLTAAEELHQACWFSGGSYAPLLTLTIRTAVGWSLRRGSLAKPWREKSRCDQTTSQRRGRQARSVNCKTGRSAVEDMKDILKMVCKTINFFREALNPQL